VDISLPGIEVYVGKLEWFEFEATKSFNNRVELSLERRER
jgi:hypothetical protein